jgi:hypothetical protein
LKSSNTVIETLTRPPLVAGGTRKVNVAELELREKKALSRIDTWDTLKKTRKNVGPMIDDGRSRNVTDKRLPPLNGPCRSGRIREMDGIKGASRKNGTSTVPLQGMSEDAILSVEVPADVNGRGGMVIATDETPKLKDTKEDKLKVPADVTKFTWAVEFGGKFWIAAKTVDVVVIRERWSDADNKARERPTSIDWEALTYSPQVNLLQARIRTK